MRRPTTRTIAAALCSAALLAAAATVAVQDGGTQPAWAPEGVRVVTEPEGATIAGRLVSDHPAGAAVRLYRVGERAPLAVAELGQAGSFRFAGLGEGRYRLDAPGTRRRVDLAAGEQAQLILP